MGSVSTVFSRDGCPHCARAKGLLRDAGVDFEELVLNRDYTDRTLRAVAASETFPQIFINGVHIGGANEFGALETAGRLDELLNS